MKSRAFALPATLALCCVLTGCSGLANIEQKSIYHDDPRIAQGSDTYSVVDSRGSLFDRHLGELTGLETWLQLSVPEEGGAFRVDYDVTVQAGDFKIVFVDDKNVDIVCEGSGVGSRTFTLEPGDYALKAVGTHAGADIELALQASEGVTAVDPDGPLGDPRDVEIEPLEDNA
ncbi:hypothetical protein [Eggerthella guodeyinii]|uniref:Lipoprotein n=1 Tax=Eggerthella guodeyinii TaxID=2690837 RepID=A0A6N7RP16_9ACTN|nr:hypothetical protein [Eggerthella guodeyinii]MRX82727.1 hypothetical protein [Eggerthella guodeyinii]